MVQFPAPNQKISARELAQAACTGGATCDEKELIKYFEQEVNLRQQKGVNWFKENFTADPAEILEATLCKKEPTTDELSCRDIAFEDKERVVTALRDDGSFVLIKDIYIDAKEAKGFVDRMRQGHSDELTSNKLAGCAYDSILRAFFGCSPLDREHDTFDALKVKDAEFVDGDTLKTITAFIEGVWQTVKMTLRLDGIDTPESSMNSKTARFINGLWKYYHEVYGVPVKYEGAMKRLISDRIIYLGKIAGITMKGFAAYAAKNNIEYYIEPAFDRGTDDPAMCNGIDNVDTYGRGLGAVHAGNGGKEAIANFIWLDLPKIMANEGKSEGKALYDLYSSEHLPAGFKLDEEKEVSTPIAAFTKEGGDVLKELKGKEEWLPVWKALSPETLPKPSEIYSADACKALALAWNGADNLQAMVVHLGLGWTYQKYLSDQSKLLLATQKPTEDAKLGLWGDTLFQLMNPNPTTSDLFAKYGDEMSDKPLLPADCCDVLLKSGGDVYNHCPK